MSTSVKHVRYTIVVKTADSIAGGSGTDDIRFQFKGTKMRSTEMRCLDMDGVPNAAVANASSPTGRDNVLFRAGSVHKFHFMHQDLGDITELKVIYNNPNKDSWIPVPGWDLASAVVSVESRMFEFFTVGRLSGSITIDCSRYMTVKGGSSAGKR